MCGSGARLGRFGANSNIKKPGRICPGFFVSYRLENASPTFVAMATKTEELKVLIQYEMEDWAAGFISARVAFLSKGISRSGVLTDSISATINQQARREAVELLVSFSEHGRFIDMKPTAQDRWGRQAISRLEDWIGRVGLEKFLPGYIKRYGIPDQILTDERLKNRIAWGIVRRRAVGKYRRRRWWNKSKQRAISELLNQVAAKMPTKVAEQVTETLKPQ